MTQETIYPVRPPKNPGWLPRLGSLNTHQRHQQYSGRPRDYFFRSGLHAGHRTDLFPFTILPAVLGIFEVMYAIKLLANPAETTEIFSDNRYSGNCDLAGREWAFTDCRCAGADLRQ